MISGEEISRVEVDAHLPGGGQNNRLLSCRDYTALTPALNRGRVLVPQRAGQIHRPPEFGDYPIDITNDASVFHAPTLRMARKKSTWRTYNTRKKLRGMSKSVPNQLRAFLNRSGLSMSSLARKMDRKAASSIQRYFSDDEFAGPFLSLPVAREFAKALAGTGDPAIGQAEVMALAGPDAPGQVAASVPEIDSIAAGEWGDITDPYPNGGAAAWIPITANVGPRAFALRITGRSMEPTYVEGDIVIVDPDIEPIPGDDVVAKIDGEERATFKRYRRRTPTEVELMPLNEMFPVLTIDKKNKGKIVGVMVEHHRYRHASR